METTVTEGATTIWTSIGETITEVTNLMGTMSNSMLKNDLFLMVLGLVIFGIGLGLVFTLVRKIKRRGN